MSHYLYGISIHYFPDSKEAIEHLNTLDSNLSPDHTPAANCLILCDPEMPKMDGLDLLGRIRMLRRIKNLPVVIFSSSDEPRGVEHARALGAVDYVTKPIQLDRFEEALRMLCDRWLPQHGWGNHRLPVKAAKRKRRNNEVHLQRQA